MPQNAAEAPFDWPIYADATFAGLSVLIPIPLMDLAFERFFRRRMVGAIARRRGYTLPPPVQAELRKGTDGGLLSGCVMLPFKATIWLVKTIFRKIAYFLTVKDATDQLSYYWQRAFLLAHIFDQGHAGDPATAMIARAAMESVLETSSSPLRGLAGQISGSTRHVLTTLRRARRGKEDDTAHATEERMRQQWTTFAPYLRALARRYDETFEQLRNTSPQQPQS